MFALSCYFSRTNWSREAGTLADNTAVISANVTTCRPFISDARVSLETFHTGKFLWVSAGGKRKCKRNRHSFRLSSPSCHFYWFLTMVFIWLFFLLLAILYDNMIVYVGLFGHSAVVFHVFMFWLTVCVVVFFQWHFVDLFSCIAASLFNKLTYFLTYSKIPFPAFCRNLFLHC